MQLKENAGGPVVFARLLIGLIVLICSEGFSGASLGMGLWNPWTLVFYAIALVGIALHRRREPLPLIAAVVEDRELRLVKLLFGLMLVSALVLSVPPLNVIVIVPIVLNFIIWSCLGAMLFWVAFHDGGWERFQPCTGRRSMSNV